MTSKNNCDIHCNKRRNCKTQLLRYFYTYNSVFPWFIRFAYQCNNVISIYFNSLYGAITLSLRCHHVLQLHFTHTGDSTDITAWIHIFSLTRLPIYIHPHPNTPTQPHMHTESIPSVVLPCTVAAIDGPTLFLALT